MEESTEAEAEQRTNSAMTTADPTISSGGGKPTDHQADVASAVEPEAPAPESTDREGLPLDETFELLRNHRRRYVLQYLQAATGPVSMSELAEQIAAWENDKEVRQITSSERKRVYVGLYQCHLPKMDGMGVISFNKPRGLIERGEYIDAVEPYLERIEVSEPSPSVGPRVGLSVVGLTVLPATVLVLSQAVLSLAVAVAVALVATLAGVRKLHQMDAERDPAADEQTVQWAPGQQAENR